MYLKTIGGALAAVLMLAVPASAEDLQFVLTNVSSWAVKSFYTSPVDERQWEEDVFGDGYLPAGNQVTINVVDGRTVCIYDMKFVLEDDSEFIENAVNLCELGEYTLSDAE